MSQPASAPTSRPTNSAWRRRGRLSVARRLSPGPARPRSGRRVPAGRAAAAPPRSARRARRAGVAVRRRWRANASVCIVVALPPCFAGSHLACQRGDADEPGPAQRQHLSCAGPPGVRSPCGPRRARAHCEAPGSPARKVLHSLHRKYNAVSSCFRRRGATASGRCPVRPARAARRRQRARGRRKERAPRAGTARSEDDGRSCRPDVRSHRADQWLLPRPPGVGPDGGQLTVTERAAPGAGGGMASCLGGRP